MPEPQANTKICRICGVEKPIEAFPPRYRQCRDCIGVKRRQFYLANAERLKGKSRRWREANLKKARAYTAEWRKRNPGRAKAKVEEWHAANRERRLEYLHRYFEENREAYRLARREQYWANADEAKRKASEWRRANPDKARQNNRSWREKNITRVKGNVRKWHENNPESVKASHHARRARKTGGRFTKADILDLLESQLRKCANCRVDLAPGYHIDHIMPLFRGGLNVAGNLQLLCSKCNLRKGSKDPYEWAQENGRLF